MPRRLSAEKKAHLLKTWQSMSHAACHDLLSDIVTELDGDEFDRTGTFIFGACYNVRKCVWEDGRPLPDEVVESYVFEATRDLPPSIASLRDWQGELRACLNIINRNPGRPGEWGGAPDD